MSCFRYVNRFRNVMLLYLFLFFFKDIIFKLCVRCIVFYCGVILLIVDKLDLMLYFMFIEFFCIYMIYKIFDYFLRIVLVDILDFYLYVFIYVKSVFFVRRMYDVYDLLKRDKINVIVFFYDNDVNYVVMLWVIWMLGVVVFLLNYVYFIEDLEYFLIDFMVLFLLII